MPADHKPTPTTPEQPPKAKAAPDPGKLLAGIRVTATAEVVHADGTKD